MILLSLLRLLLQFSTSRCWQISCVLSHIVSQCGVVSGLVINFGRLNGNFGLFSS